MSEATPFYRAIMVEVERRRNQLGLPMWQVDDAAGLNDGYYSKMLWTDPVQRRNGEAPPTRDTGRQAGWAMMQLVIQALFPDGFDIEIKPRKGPCISALLQRSKIKAVLSEIDPKTYRERMRELGARGGRAPKRHRLTKRERQRLAKERARKGWETRRRRQTTAGMSEGLIA